jgi:hypothetical protein
MPCEGPVRHAAFRSSAPQEPNRHLPFAMYWTSCRRPMALPNLRLKLSARWRRLCRNAQWKPSFLSAAPAGRSLSATR